MRGDPLLADAAPPAHEGEARDGPAGLRLEQGQAAAGRAQPQILRVGTWKLNKGPLLGSRVCYSRLNNGTHGFVSVSGKLVLHCFLGILTNRLCDVMCYVKICPKYEGMWGTFL